MNILLVGVAGNMGQKIINCVDDEVKIQAGIDIENINIKGIKIYNNFTYLQNKDINNIDVVLDFALPSVLDDELEFCKKYNKKLVICSTGHSDIQNEKIKEYSKFIPIFKTSNTSMGIAFLNKIICDYSYLFNQFDVTILEKHHKNKKDAPSGTAMTMINEFKNLRINVKNVSIRGGSVIGEHEIILCGEGEQIYIKHIAENRELFVKGALKICKFISNQNQNKLYSMKDLI